MYTLFVTALWALGGGKIRRVPAVLVTRTMNRIDLFRLLALVFTAENIYLSNYLKGTTKRAFIVYEFRADGRSWRNYRVLKIGDLFNGLKGFRWTLSTAIWLRKGTVLHWPMKKHRGFLSTRES